MKKGIISFIAAIALLWILVGIGSYYFADKVKRAQNDLSSHLGEKFVIGKDTLIIVDYSTLDETYKLSNGTSISSKLINNGK